MITIWGKGVSGGYAFGRIAFFKRNEKPVERRPVEDASAETERFLQARAVAAAQVVKLYDKAVAYVGEDEAQIFDIHRLMLEDEDFLDAVKDAIAS